MQPAIKINNLSVTLGHKYKALKNVSFDLPSGHIIGLLGPSGAGKTTLMRAIIGRQLMSSGEAEVLGYPAGSKYVRSQIGYMPQQASIYNDLTVQENLNYFAAVAGVPKKQVGHVLDEVQMAKYADKLAAKLSGGQQARVSLAVALLGDPPLLVLDEPTVGIDPVLRAQLWGIFRKLADGGHTLLISSHVMDEASHCDTLLLIRDGKLLTIGAPASLCREAGVKTVEELFLSLIKREKV